MRRDPHGGDLSEQDPFWRWPAAVLDLFESSDDRAYGALVQALARQAGQRGGGGAGDGLHVPAPDGGDQGVRAGGGGRDPGRGPAPGGRLPRALEDAFARSGGDPRREASYDSADPRQDQLADVLIQYLVRTDYAQVRTTERGPGQYV